LPCVRFVLEGRGCAQMRMGGRSGGHSAVSGPARDSPVTAAASVAVRGVGRQRRAAPLARGCHCAPCALRRRPRAGGALPLPAPAALRLVCSAVAPALAARSPRARLLLYEWCVTPALAERRSYPRDWRCQLPTFCCTSASCLLCVNRLLPFSACRPQSAADLADHASRAAAKILRTVYSRGWAANRPPIQGTIDQKVALSGVSLLHILPILGRYNRRPVKGRHVASPTRF